MKLTRRNLKRYLQSAPDKEHKCGSTKHCVLANFLAERGDFPEGTIAVSVMPARNAKDTYGGIALFEGPGGVRVERRLPGWAGKLANNFDEMRNAWNPTRSAATATSARILEELACDIEPTPDCG